MMSETHKVQFYFDAETADPETKRAIYAEIEAALNEQLGNIEGITHVGRPQFVKVQHFRKKISLNHRGGKV